MRLNKFIANATGKSRREADVLIASGRVKIDGVAARLGMPAEKATITLDGKKLTLPEQSTLIMLNKPIGYVSSRRAQSPKAKTLYQLLPPEFQRLKTVGRLDRDSSGLILLTDDGDLAYQMTHPKFAKTKIYQVELDRPLEPLHQQMISDFGLDLPDGKSRLTLEKIVEQQKAVGVTRGGAVSKKLLANFIDRKHWQVTMHEGRNRQIRRTFAALGYKVIKLHRTDFGDYHLGGLKVGKWKIEKPLAKN
jgi:23S rRNA pseudouridine2605 synthase